MSEDKVKVEFDCILLNCRNEYLSTCLTHKLKGYAFRDKKKRFEDGDFIVTSCIKSELGVGDGVLVTTENSTYLCYFAETTAKLAKKWLEHEDAIIPLEESLTK